MKSRSSQEESCSSSDIEFYSEESHYESDLLIVRRLMSSLVGEEVETQKENIFHYRCLVLGKLCSIIIDGESSVNVANLRRKIVVDKQVTLVFILGNYKDEVMYDVVSMEATHILLEGSWQYDRRVTYVGLTNRFTFKHLEHKDVLPKEVPHGLPPLRGTKHHINLTLGATLPNKAIYKINYKEAKEIQHHVAS
ncbi:hypothetical protein CR513_29878, partial [Mucuna pruriens]